MKGKYFIGYLLPNFINVTNPPDSIRERDNSLLCIYIHSLQDIAYINSLVMYDEVGPDGQLHSYIDEDMKIQVQMKIVDALQNKWRKLI